MVSVHMKAQLSQTFKLFAANITFDVHLLVPLTVKVISTTTVERYECSRAVRAGIEVGTSNTSTGTRVVILDTFNIIVIEHPLVTFITLVTHKFKITKFTVGQSIGRKEVDFDWRSWRVVELGECYGSKGGRRVGVPNHTLWDVKTRGGLDGEG